MNFVGVIPARGGSKGIKMKNLISFNGKPLIYWTIRHAKISKLLDDFFVSSDNEEILNYAISQGVKVHYRNSKLSSDDSTTLDLLMSLNEEKEFSSENYVILQPTSPLRKNNIIDECISIFTNNNYDCLATGKMCKSYEWGKTNNEGRQNLKGWFYDDGNLYILSRNLIQKGKWFGISQKKIVQGFPWNLEIDDENDLKILEFIIQNKEQFLFEDS